MAQGREKRVPAIALYDKAGALHLIEGPWIGMNSVILPGVTLGPGTVVGAGSVVTHSFPEGHCVIAGVPAKLIRNLQNEKEA